MKKRVVVYLIVFQCIFIVFLILGIINKNKIANVSSNPISSGSISYIPNGKLLSFYEPTPNHIEEANLSWLGKDYDYTVRYKINPDALNQTTNIAVIKPKNTFRIAAIGESFTFGENVNTEDSYPSQLQKLLDEKCTSKIKFEVLNLGERGYDFQYAVNRFKIRGVKYGLDLVIWHIGRDNFLRVDELLIPLVKKYNKEIMESGNFGKLLTKGNMHPAWKKAVNQVLKEIGNEETLLKLQKNNIEEIFKYYDKNLVFTTITNFPSKYKAILGNITNSHKNIYLYTNITDIFVKDILPDSHPTKNGYRIIAEDTFQFLKKSELIPCN